jgi:hypothetical protein
MGSRLSFQLSVQFKAGAVMRSERGLRAPITSQGQQWNKNVLQVLQVLQVRQPEQAVAKKIYSQFQPCLGQSVRV